MSPCTSRCSCTFRTLLGVSLGLGRTISTLQEASGAVGRRPLYIPMLLYLQDSLGRSFVSRFLSRFVRTLQGVSLYRMRLGQLGGPSCQPSLSCTSRLRADLVGILLPCTLQEATGATGRTQLSTQSLLYLHLSLGRSFVSRFFSRFVRTLQGVSLYRM